MGCLETRAADTLTQAEAESRLRQLKTEIDSLKEVLERARTSLSKEQKALEAADLEIQSNALRLMSKNLRS